MISRSIPVIIRSNPNRVNPRGFHASLLYTSDNPTVLFPVIASAVAARSAAALLARFIPPDPRRNKMPRGNENYSLKKWTSSGVNSGCDEKND